MNVLLTGPSGFIGSALARLALNKGHAVAGLLIPTEPIPSRVPAHPRLHWLRGTLETAPWEEIGAFRPDVCVHAAWITTPGVYLESPENYRFLEQSRQFLKEVRELGARQIVGLGTCVEYRITDSPLSEAMTPIEPTTTYARCKNELRLSLEADAKQHGYTFSWARVFYPYGPGEHPSRLCSSIIDKLTRGEPVTLRTPNSTKDYIYIEDLAAALLAVVESKIAGCINIGTGVGISVKQIAQTLADLLGKPELIQEAPSPDADPFGYIVADASKLRGLGWQPSYSLERGLRQLVESTRGQD